MELNASAGSDAQLCFPLTTSASGREEDGDAAGVTPLVDNKMSSYELL